MFTECNDEGYSFSFLSLVPSVMFIYFSLLLIQGTISIFETLLIMFVTSQFQWEELQAGLVISGCGFLGMICLLQFGAFTKVFQDIDLIIYGVLIMILSCICLDNTILPAVTSWRLYLSLFLMFALGYPVGHTALIGVYSKILKSGPQGKLLGLFSSCGSLARIAFPTISGYIVEEYGFGGAFSLASIILLLSFAYLIVNRKLILDLTT